MRAGRNTQRRGPRLRRCVRPPRPHMKQSHIAQPAPATPSRCNKPRHSTPRSRPGSATTSLRRPSRRPWPGRRSRPAATCWSPRPPAPARRSRRSSPRSTIWCARASRTALPDETHVVYVSPLKALSNDIQRNLAAPLAGIRSELAALGASRRRDPHAGAHRRHAAARAREHAQAAAAHRRHDARVAVRAAGLGVRAAACCRRRAR